MDAIWKSWSDVVFQFKYDPVKYYYTFTEIEDIQIKLEDTQVAINTLMMNRFAVQLIDQIDNLSKTFQLFSDTLEEWL